MVRVVRIVDPGSWKSDIIRHASRITHHASRITLANKILTMREDAVADNLPGQPPSSWCRELDEKDSSSTQGKVHDGYEKEGGNRQDPIP